MRERRVYVTWTEEIIYRVYVQAESPEEAGDKAYDAFNKIAESGGDIQGVKEIEIDGLMVPIAWEDDQVSGIECEVEEDWHGNGAASGAETTS